MILKENFYAIIDVEKREKIEIYKDSSLRKHYNGQVVELVGEKIGYDELDALSIIKWIWRPGSTGYYAIPEGCYTRVTKEENPEYFL